MRPSLTGCRCQLARAGDRVARGEGDNVVVTAAAYRCATGVDVVAASSYGRIRAGIACGCGPHASGRCHVRALRWSVLQLWRVLSQKDNGMDEQDVTAISKDGWVMQSQGQGRDGIERAQGHTSRNTHRSEKEATGTLCLTNEGMTLRGRATHSYRDKRKNGRVWGCCHVHQPSYVACWNNLVGFLVNCGRCDLRMKIRWIISARDDSTTSEQCTCAKRDDIIGGTN